MDEQKQQAQVPEEKLEEVTGGGMKNPWESMEEQRAPILPLTDQEAEGAAGGMPSIKEREGFF